MECDGILPKVTSFRSSINVKPFRLSMIVLLFFQRIFPYQQYRQICWGLVVCLSAKIITPSVVVEQIIKAPAVWR